MLDRAVATTDKSNESTGPLFDRAISDTEDAIQVLTGGGLHPEAAAQLHVALDLIRQARSATNPELRARYANDAIAAETSARIHLSD